ncbi:hypothetical protein BDV18DRAFT_136937 [Aspergillus unguis]
MKTTLASIILTLTSALAAPTAAPQSSDPNPYPYSIDQITLYHLIESNTWDLTISVTPRGPYSDATGPTFTCHSAWNDGATTVGREVCANAAYSFWLPNGATNPDDSWAVVVDGPSGEAEGVVEYGPRYSCGEYTGDIGNIDRECVTRNGGWFFLKEAEADA